MERVGLASSAAQPTPRSTRRRASSARAQAAFTAPPHPSTSDVLAYWDARAPRYETGVVGEWHSSIAAALAEVAAPLPGERVILDLGCGTGLASRCAAIKGAVVHGVDLSPAMLAVARVKAGMQSASFSTSDAQTLDGFSPASFDLVLASALVPYLPDPPAALRRWKELLKPGGRVAFSGFRLASMNGELLVRAAASLGIPLDFERWTGSAERCAALLSDAGFSRIQVHSIPIADTHTKEEAKAALEPMLRNPLSAPLLANAYPQRLREAYDRLVEAEADAQGLIHTRGECFLARGDKL